MIDNSYIFIVGGISAASFMVLAVYFYLDTKRSYRYDVPGLRNMGATCFVNALLQGLAGCRSFVGWTYRFMFYRHCIFLQSLAEILQKLNENTGETLSAAWVVNALRRRGWILETYSQQDVHELLNVFCSTWSEELSVLKNAKASMQAIVSAFQRNSNSFPQADSENADELPAIEFPISPCEGLINVQNECLRCGNKSVQREAFCSITLNFGADQTKMVVTLEECLENFLEREMVEDVACEFCSQGGSSSETRTARNRTVWLDKCPECMIFTFQRINWSSYGTAIKLFTVVKLPEWLDMGQVCQKERPRCESESKNFDTGEAPSADEFPDEYLYRLQAVIVHQGGVNSGHFVTYRRSIIDERCWVALSDAMVSPVDFEKISQCQAYMVFYERDEGRLPIGNSSDSGPTPSSFE